MSSLNRSLDLITSRHFVGLLLTIDLAVIAVSLTTTLRTETGGLALLIGTGSIAMSGFLTYLLLLKPARTSRQLLWIHAADIAALTATAIWLPIAVPLIVAAAGFHFFYIHRYSALDRSQPSPLKVDQPLPNFSVTNQEGHVLSSQQLSTQPRVILFFRGNWCPLCMAQIQEIAASYQELERRGYTVTLISPQPEGQTKKLADRFDVEFDFYTDLNNQAAKKLGIEHQNGSPAGIAAGYEADTVLPTVLITDAAGIVRWLHMTDNYRIRPEPAIFLQAIDSLNQNETTDDDSNKLRS